MATPTYTPTVPAEPVPIVPRHLDAQPRSVRGLSGTIRRLARLAASPLLVQASLDLAAVAFTVMAFAGIGASAEFLFHGVFVVLVLHAFLFGLRGTLLRIGLASIPLLVYVNAASFGITEPPLELTEWPLMFVIAALVAWMAEKRSSTSRRYATLFRRASERLLTVEENERRRIAGELHDGVGQVLTALTLTLDAAAADSDARRIRSRVEKARSLADTALAGTRDLSHRIRPARLEERGLVATIRDLGTLSGFDVRIDAEPDCEMLVGLGATTIVELYRITQEALANAAHHSGADGAQVVISCGDGRLTVTVSDDGCGFDRAAVQDAGIGLAGMEERARLLGGQLAIESAPGAGTRVRLSIGSGPANAAS